MELIRGRERDEYLVRLSGEERERLESLVRASKSSCATADEGGQLIPSTGLRPRCLFSSSRIALIFRPRQKERQLPARLGRRPYPVEESRRSYIGPRADARE
jgi:hypothetical protein